MQKNPTKRETKTGIKKKTPKTEEATKSPQKND